MQILIPRKYTFESAIFIKVLLLFALKRSDSKRIH